MGPCSVAKYLNIDGSGFCQCSDCADWLIRPSGEKTAAGWSIGKATNPALVAAGRGAVFWIPPVGHRLYGQYMAATTTAPPPSSSAFRSNGFGSFGPWPISVPGPIGGYPGSHLEPGPVTKKSDGKLPPMNCKRCNFRNEYVGPEHLAKDGTYTCRGCK